MGGRVLAPEKNHWEWDIGKKGLHLRGDRIFYALVDLKWNREKPNEKPNPDVYIVPSNAVADKFRPNMSRYMFWIKEGDGSKYLERWDLIKSILGG
jgi:hypothetical protein